MTESARNKIIRMLGSLRLSFALMLLMGVLASLRALVAQRFAMEEGSRLLWFIDWIGLSTPEPLAIPFYITLAAFTVNLVFSTILMASKVVSMVKGMGAQRGFDALSGTVGSVKIESLSGGLRHAAQAIRRAGYKVVMAEEGFVAVRHKAGHSGVMLFHLALFLIVGGMLISALSRFYAYEEATPGGAFIIDQEALKISTGPPAIDPVVEGYRVFVEDMDVSYWSVGKIRQRASLLQVRRPDGSLIVRDWVRVNKPMQLGWINVYQAAKHGFVADVVFSDTEGTQSSGTVRFRIPESEDGKLQNAVRLPGAELAVYMELFTERIRGIKGLEVLGNRHQATLIKAWADAYDGRKPLGAVFLGGNLEFGGITMHFRALSPYTSFFISRDYGMPFILAGCAVLVAGLIAMYFWVPEYVWAASRADAGGREEMVLLHHCERFQESARERFMEAVAALRKEMETL